MGAAGALLTNHSGVSQYFHQDVRVLEQNNPEEDSCTAHLSKSLC
jgi:hypothetical protein